MEITLTRKLGMPGSAIMALILAGLATWNLKYSDADTASTIFLACLITTVGVLLARSFCGGIDPRFGREISAVVKSLRETSSKTVIWAGATLLICLIIVMVTEIGAGAGTGAHDDATGAAAIINNVAWIIVGLAQITIAAAYAITSARPMLGQILDALPANASREEVFLVEAASLDLVCAAEPIATRASSDRLLASNTLIAINYWSALLTVSMILLGTTSILSAAARALG